MEQEPLYYLTSSYFPAAPQVPTDKDTLAPAVLIGMGALEEAEEN